jgi:hypothetical protein
MTGSLPTTKERPVALSVGKVRKGHRLTIDMDVTDPKVVEAISTTLDEALNLFISQRGHRMRLKAERVVDAIYDRVTPLLVDVEEVLEIRKTVDDLFASGKWMTHAQIHQAHPRFKNASEPASDWKRRGRIFAVHYDGVDYFPRYQFDRAMQPLPIMADILKALGPIADTWTIAAWMVSPNGWLDGKVPFKMLDEGDAVVHAARMRKDSYVA